MTAAHWKAERTAHPGAKGGEGWELVYDPTPGGRKNEDGTTSFSLRFPALLLSEYVAEPEKVAHAIADMLNRAEPVAQPHTSTEDNMNRPFTSHADEIAAMASVPITRPRLFGDMIALARALYAVPAPRRQARLDAILHVTETAYDWQRRYQRTHGNFGDGSISAAALQIGSTWRKGEPTPSSEGDLMDHDWIACMSMALDAMKDLLDSEDARAREVQEAARAVG